MKIRCLLCCVAIAAAVVGCASFDTLKPGRSMAEVERQFHVPSGKRSEANGNQVWEYNLGPQGRGFWLLTFGPDGTLIQANQALTEENFRNIRFGQSTRDEVTHLLGPPYRKYNFTNLGEEVWDYRYARGSWAMLLSMHFDSGRGLVKSYVTQTDPEAYAARGRGRRR